MFISHQPIQNRCPGPDDVRRAALLTKPFGQSINSLRRWLAAAWSRWQPHRRSPHATRRMHALSPVQMTIWKQVHECVCVCARARARPRACAAAAAAAAVAVAAVWTTSGFRATRRRVVLLFGGARARAPVLTICKSVDERTDASTHACVARLTTQQQQQQLLPQPQPQPRQHYYDRNDSRRERECTRKYCRPSLPTNVRACVRVCACA